MIAQLNDIAQVWWQWMAGMFWQVSLLIILVTLLDMAIRRWAWPQVRYVLWGLVFLKLIIPPTWQMPTSIVSWIQPQIEKQIPIRIETRDVTAKDQQITISGVPSQTTVTKPVVKTENASWQAIVLLTWLAGMIAFGLMLIIKMSRLPKGPNKQDEQSAPEWFHELLARTARRLNLKKIPTIVFSKDTKSPAVYGVFRPVLLLPEGCLEQLSQEQAEHVLMHELCHLKRGDLLVHWFCLILQVVYWFNPLLIWTRRQMRHVCEICCDISVANLLREKTRDYRDTLLATAKELLAESVEPGFGLLGVFEEPFRLVSRLRWLEKKTWENRKRKLAATIVTSLIMVVCVMPMAGLSQTSSQNNSHADRSDAGPVESNGQVIQDKNDIFQPMILIEGIIMEADEGTDLGLGMERQGALPESQKGLISMGMLFREGIKGISIGGKSFSDIKAVIEAMKTEPGVHILGTPQMLTLNNKNATLNTSNPKLVSGYVLDVTPKILEDGIVLQEISLNIYQPVGEESQGIIITKNINTTASVKAGSTLVMGMPATKDSTGEKKSTDRKDLYLFLTTHVFKTPEEVQSFQLGLKMGS